MSGAVQRIAAGATTRASRPVVLVLAAHEGRRLLTHPVMLAGWGVYLVMFPVGQLRDPNPFRAFEVITTGFTFFPGLFCVFAAHLVTTRDQRAGADELVGAVPATREQRVGALLLACAAPALVALTLNALMRQYLIWQDEFVQIPSFAHTAQAPATVLGGCLLGVMLGVWLPQGTTPVLAMVGLVALSIAFGWSLFVPMVSWADWGPTDGTVWWALVPGNANAHLVYLLGLCGLAGVAAWLRVTSRHWVAIALGVAFLTLAMWGGMAQLP